jgi:hypothetical protein
MAIGFAFKIIRRSNQLGIYRRGRREAQRSQRKSHRGALRRNFFPLRPLRSDLKFTAPMPGR